jgi:drug/metabolite transporter (DMT)-like permease
MDGLLLVTIAVLLTSVGVIIEKKALLKFRKFVLRKVLKDPLWIAGFLLTIIGGGAYLWAISISEITVIQPLANLTIPIVAILGVFLLKEKFHLKEILGIMLMFVGAILLTLVIL